MLQFTITSSVHVRCELVSTVSVARMLVLAVSLGSAWVGGKNVSGKYLGCSSDSGKCVIGNRGSCKRVFVKTVTVESLLMGAVAWSQWQVCWW